MTQIFPPCEGLSTQSNTEPISNTKEALRCFHCGDVCPDASININEKYFCCQGCKVVYEILDQNDLCNYYAISENPGVSRKGDADAGKFKYLDEPKIAEKILHYSDEKISVVSFFVPSMHCSSCIWLLERLYRFDERIVSSQVNFLAKRISVTFNRTLPMSELAALITALGYEPQVLLDEKDKEQQQRDQKTLYIKTGIAGFAFGNIMLLSFPEYLGIDQSSNDLRVFFSIIILILSLPVFFYCSSGYFISAYKGLRKRTINIDVPLSIGILALFIQSVYDIIVGAGPGFIDSFSGLILFLLVGRVFQDKTYEAFNFERNYQSYFPISVTVRKEGKEEYKPLAELQIGDKVVIRNGELIPADGIVLNGEGNIDYSFVTGEAYAVKKQSGEFVYSGGRHTGKSVEIEIMKEVSQSYLTRLWNDFESSKRPDSSMTTFSNTVSKYFTVAVLLIAAAGFLLHIGDGIRAAVYVFSSVLIVACPCALALSTPFALGNALRIMGRNKFFLKSSSTIETLAKITTVIFDKTGTLTEAGRSEVSYLGETLTTRELSALKGVLLQSTHPLSRIVAGNLDVEPLKEIDSFNDFPGEGISGSAGGITLKAGSLRFTGMTNAEGVVISDREHSVETRVYISVNEMPRGYFRIGNKYRDGITAMAAEIEKEYEVEILSGDTEAEKENLSVIFPGANALQFNMNPVDKRKHIEEHLSAGKRVMMVGDGLNDASALAQSTAGISVTEDVYNFTPSSDGIISAKALYLLPQFLNFTKQSVRVIQESFVISLVYNVIGLSVALTGNLSPLFAAILMPVSSVTVVVYTTLRTAFTAKRKGLL